MASSIRVGKATATSRLLADDRGFYHRYVALLALDGPSGRRSQKTGLASAPLSAFYTLGQVRLR